jgi:CHAT domain
VSLASLQSRIKQLQRELDRHRRRQSDEEARAARLDKDGAQYEEQARRSSLASTAKSKLHFAGRKRDDAIKARAAAAKASKAYAETQQKLHRAQADLGKALAREEKQARERSERDRRAAERRQATEARARDLELAQLASEAANVRAQLDAKPWLAAPEAITVLFIAAAPEDEPPLRLDQEVREIQQRVRASEHRDAVRFEVRLATRTTDLLQALNEVRPHVVHFSGHGTQDSLVFEDEDGYARPLTNSDLAQLLHISSDRIRLAIFNSCDSARQAALACDHIDSAIGMDEPVEDDSAKIFAGQFYNALGFGKSLREAFAQAQLQVKLATGSESGAPQLHTAPGVDPDRTYLVKPP